MNLNLLSQNNYQYLNLIDWENISHKMSDSAYFEATKEDIQQFPRLLENKEILAIHRTQDIFAKSLDNESFRHFYQQLQHVGSDFKFDEFLLRLQKSAIFTLKEINKFTLLFESFHHIKDISIKEHLDDHLANFSQVAHKKFIRPIRRFIFPNGDIDYSLHPILRELHSTISKYDIQAKKVISRLIQVHSQKLQIDTYDILNDHYVLMFKTDQYEHKLGFIHARSDSRQTLYIEPPELSELSLKRKKASLEIEKILYKISKEYSELLCEYYLDVKSTLEYVLHVDLNYAKAMYYSLTDMIKPELADEPEIIIRGFFHPLISEPIKNDINLSKQKGIIISGPNTGGKTVALKSMCLNILLTSSGHYVPCESAKVYPFKEIYYLSQDHQSIDKGLSSFAAESLHHLNLLNQIKGDSVIFIDEIFNTTSSEEASALALGLFEYLEKTINPFIFVSTHHQMLKILTHQSKKFLSYNVGFNDKTYSPDYRLYADGPGSSQALNIFEKLGENFEASKEILKTSKQVLDKKYLDYENLLTEVAKKKSLLEKEYTRQKDLTDQLENQHQSQQGLLKLKMKERLQELEVEIDKMRTQTHQVLRDVKSGKITTAKNIDKRIFDAKDKIIPKEQAKASNYDKVDLPVIGNKYLYVPMNKKAIVLKVDKIKEKVILDLNGKFKIEAKFFDLAPIQHNKNQVDDGFKFNVNRVSSDSLSLDARGMRLADFQTQVDQHLTSLYAGSIPYLEIIHGHGSGTLKNWLRKFLKNKKDLEIEIPRKSLDGSTIIKLS